MIKQNDFITALRSMLGWGYVMGGKGQLYTQPLAEAWGKARQGSEPASYFTSDCARWFGHHVVDCSGLITCAIRAVDQNYPITCADDLYRGCKESGAISGLPEIPGVCVHRTGHIGVYLGGGNVIESGGHLIGVVISNIKQPATGTPWTGWGKLADVDYSQSAPTPAPVTTAAANFTLSVLVKKGAQGSAVQMIQKALNAHGANPQLAADGIFGDKTLAAVKTFQKQNSLSVDGIVGKQTVTALGGKWTGK